MSLAFFVIGWLKKGVAIIIMDKFTNVTRGKQQPQTQHNGNLYHTIRSMLKVKCNIGYGNPNESDKLMSYFQHDGSMSKSLE